MSYGLIQTAAQVAHLRVGQAQLQVGHAQLHQLAYLNSQIAIQQQMAAFQANLHQALFETERMARRIAATVPEDLFSAGVHAYYWLQRLSGIGPQHFQDVANKRAYGDAYDSIAAALRRAQQTPDVNGSLATYLELMHRLNQLRAAIGDDEERYLGGYNAQLEQAQSRERKAKIHLIIGSVAAAVILVLALAALAENGPGAGLALVAAVIIGGFSKSLIDERRRVAGRARELADAEEAVARLHAFMEDPKTGGYLTHVWSEHPLLFNEPIPEASPTSGGSTNTIQTYVERRIVERQTVVTRCKFCHQNTPVDAPVCQSCGAPGFGS